MIDAGSKHAMKKLAATQVRTPPTGSLDGHADTGSRLAEGLPQPGDVLSGKYRIEACLGKGGMGMVFRATHLLSEKPVALKRMLRPTTDSNATGRFVREARAAGRIDHPNVVDVYDVGEDGKFGYLVMELLHGESLCSRLDHGPLSVAEAVDLLVPAMRGVAAAHKAGVIHRDLKPDNIFLCKGPDGVPREAKVLDFGISSFTNLDAGDVTLTKDGALLGTPAYMSPEQLKSTRDLDCRTDVYSFGVILYEVLTGHVPFSDESFTGLVLAIAHNDPPRLRTMIPELPSDLEQVVLRAIARSRDDRFPDMESFIAALQPFSARQVSTRPSAPRPRDAQPSRDLNRLEFELLSTPATVEPRAEQGLAARVSSERPVLMMAKSARRVPMLGIAFGFGAALLVIALLARGTSRTHTSSPPRSAPALAPRPETSEASAASAPRGDVLSPTPADVGASNGMASMLHAAPQADSNAQLEARSLRRGAAAIALHAKAGLPAPPPPAHEPAARSGTISVDDL